ncbi:MAG: hypothetical protein RJA57_2021 [Bacteroidota bacterium]
MQEKTFQGTVTDSVNIGDTMSLKGTLNKFGVLIALMTASTLLAWSQFYKGSDPKPLMYIGVFGGLALALIMAFRMRWAAFLAPAYAICEGLFVGSISAMYNFVYPGLPVQAVFLTLLVTLLMFLIYRFRIIRVTSKFRMVIVVATSAVALFYLIQWLTYVITGSAIATELTSSNTPMSIGFSILMVALASFNLLLNFDTIETGVQMKAPRFMEWYGAFGLLVTVVWLYLEILRLLSKFRE